MSAFVGGPADGRTLALRRAPALLRVVVAADGTVDALDQPADEPRPDERVHVYVRVKASAHVCTLSGAGCLEVAEYEHVPDVDGEQLREHTDWRAWCGAVAAANHLPVLRERRDWLTARIAAKESVGWDITWDVRERNALAWAVQQLEAKTSDSRIGPGELREHLALPHIEDVFRLCARGLPHRRHGRLLEFDVGEVEEWLAAETPPAGQHEGDVVGPDVVRQHLALGTIEAVFRLCAEGLPHRVSGMHLEFDLDEVDEWLEQREKPSLRRLPARARRLVTPEQRREEAERWRDTALAYEARARKLREDGNPVFAAEYEAAAADWRAQADVLERVGPQAVVAAGRL